jgi:hypothetical protein
MFEKCSKIQDDYGRHYGEMKIPAWAGDRWRRQMATPYKDLPDEEKESDRAEAQKIQSIIRAITGKGEE